MSRNRGLQTDHKLLLLLSVNRTGKEENSPDKKKHRKLSEKQTPRSIQVVLQSTF